MTPPRPPRRSNRRRRREAPISARELALQILVAAESRRAYSDRLLESRLRDSDLSARDAALVTTLVQGTLRYRALLDHHLAGLLHQDFEGLPLWIRAVLRLGAYQILVLTRVPDRAAVAESVELAKKYGHPGTAGLANALLRRLAKGDRAPLPDPAADPVARLAVQHSHPRWLVERWVARYGIEEASRLLESDNEEPAPTVRANAHRISTAELETALRAEGFAPRRAPNGGDSLIVEGGFVPSRSRLFREGLLSLQDASESIVVLILDPKPGERVLDLCAAPGGKAAQIAERVAPGGLLVALERHAGRARALRQNLSGRLRLPGVAVVCGDGASPPFRGGFDRVLVDAPCSGLGVLRRRADARWRKNEATIQEMAALQRALLESASTLVRAGGVLVYSVCSLEPEETDEIVEPFLNAHPEFAREDVGPCLPESFGTGGPTFRALPHRHGTDGVYGARLSRR